ELNAYRYEVQALRQEVDLYRMRLRYLEKWQQEFRGPMGAIVGFPLLMLEDVAEPFQREALEAIHDSGNILLQTVQDFFTYISAESGQMEVHSLPIEVAYIMEEAMMLPRKLAAERDIELRYQIDESVPHTVDTSRNIARQIISHLVSHAVKSTSEGHVHIQLSTVHNHRSGCDELHIIIKDTGAGYHPVALRKLQGLFEQADIDQAMFDGLETRLVMCKRLADFINGRITIESRYQKGTTTTFIVPYAPEQN
ncbi:MAG: HAMP domain-containing histidine kinase, partial [Anaerolineales bacterium]|nr:HAMP domain-containing histidine kinase [Anaerolineales bacterium]